MRVQQPPYRFRTPDRDTHAEITLSERNGELIVEKPTSDAVRAGNHVIWWIENQTSASHTVEVTNFRPKGTTTVEWPFEGSPPAAVTVPAGSIGRIKLRVLAYGPKEKHGSWVYEYDILVDGKPVEPEIVFEWP